MNIGVVEDLYVDEDWFGLDVLGEDITADAGEDGSDDEHQQFAEKRD